MPSFVRYGRTHPPRHDRPSSTGLGATVITKLRLNARHTTRLLRALLVLTNTAVSR